MKRRKRKTNLNQAFVVCLAREDVLRILLSLLQAVVLSKNGNN
jgi:hypothetical protein